MLLPAAWNVAQNRAMKRLSSFALVVVLCIAAFASNDRRDGNWWLGETEAAKLSYVTGFFDGMELGHRFSYWDMEDEKGRVKRGMSDCASKAAISASKNDEKYFNNVTNDQLVSGLDTFYSDYRNRRIRVYDARAEQRVVQEG